MNTRLSNSALGFHAAAETLPARWNSTEENILRLLTDGHSREVVASTLGITESFISQCLSNEDFRSELAARKSLVLDRYKKLDDGYDRLEQDVQTRLEHSIMMVSRPLELAAILVKLNSAKRRLQDSSIVQNTNTVQNITNINMPVTIVHKFTKTDKGHVVAIDEKSIVTIQANSLDGLVQKHLTMQVEQIPETILPLIPDTQPAK